MKPNRNGFGQDDGCGYNFYNFVIQFAVCSVKGKLNYFLKFHLMIVAVEYLCPNVI